MSETCRRPRSRLLVSGQVIAGCQSIEISSSNLSQAADFFAQVAIETATGDGSQSWFDADILDVTIQMGFLPPGALEGALSWQTMLSGRADRIHLNPVSGLVTLEGRDYAARLLDLPLSETFLNCTSSEVAQQLAGRCGLTASVDQTTTFIGQYYQIEHARTSMAPFSRFGTAWDLLSSLAQIEQFDLWVQDLTLNFSAAPLATTAPLQITFQQGRPAQASPILNVTSLSLERNLALAGSIPVVVSSWNSRQTRPCPGAGGKLGYRRERDQDIAAQSSGRHSSEPGERR